MSDIQPFARAAEELPPEISALGEAIAGLPADQRAPLAHLFARVAESTRRRRRILHLVQDALGQLRLDMKYLAFDLEATRRERDEFRRRLDEPPDRPDGGGAGR